MAKRAAPQSGGIVSVLLVDEHSLTRLGARTVLSAASDIRIVGECDTADEALKLAMALRPSVAVIDLLSGESRGYNLIRDLILHAEETRTLACTSPLPAPTIQHLLRIGAYGYLGKHEPVERLLEAVRAVSNRDIYLNARVAEQLVVNFTHGGGKGGRKTKAAPGGRPARAGAAHTAEDATPSAELIAELSESELEVFQMIGHGQSTRAIAKLQHHSIKTIETLRSRIRSKLGLKDPQSLAQQAWRYVHQLLRPALAA